MILPADLTPELSRTDLRHGGVVHVTAQAELRSGLGLNELLGLKRTIPQFNLHRDRLTAGSWTVVNRVLKVVCPVLSNALCELRESLLRKDVLEHGTLETKIGVMNNGVVRSHSLASLLFHLRVVANEVALDRSGADAE